ncbi:hypothetical protein [Abyssogena phaseoliformis symbiont]|uniref:hypothetical protein n=1 Tax=Abyssogena phaseoliformis symbiont TaxID=596095 RepID=UPI0019151E57|nr:hypothetical protein [Abyssogena phaseoliformis symbiont]
MAIWGSAIFNVVVATAVVVVQVVTAVISTVWQVGSAIFNTVGTMANSIDGAIGATGKILTAITQGAQIGFVGGITGGSLESANKGASTGLAQSIGHNWLGTGEGLTGINKHIAHGFVQGASSQNS